MRYVLINEYYSFGGAEMQSLREKHFMESKGHKVLYITFDDNYSFGWDDSEPLHFNFTPGYTHNKIRLYKCFRDRELSVNAERLIKNFDPDFIHVNNSTLYSYVISYVCRNYRTVRTIRDYGAVCPNGLCIDKDRQVCEGASRSSCLKKCAEKKSFLKFVLLYLIYQKRRFAENRSIELYMCPSRRLTEYCRKNGMKTYCVNNPFDFSAFSSDCIGARSGRIRRFLYYGQIIEHKGIFQLIEAFNEFSKDRDVTLEIAGNLDERISGRFERSISENEKICYHGQLAYSDMVGLLSQVDCVVVPSLWMENYPNTVLEGLCSGCIVLASDRGGMKEMIRDDRMIFDVLDKQDIISKLELAYNMDEQERLDIIRNNYEYVRRNNSQDAYYKRFMKVVSILLERH